MRTIDRKVEIPHEGKYFFLTLLTISYTVFSLILFNLTFLKIIKIIVIEYHYNTLNFQKFSKKNILKFMKNKFI